MARQNKEHRRKARTALLVLDMFSEFDFPDGRTLATAAARAAKHIADLKRRARRARWPVIYVNDTKDVWESDQQAFIARCMAPDCRGRKAAERILPVDGDYFIFKPRHSAFFDTPLHSLLGNLGVNRLILTGTTAHQCVLFTAVDAHIRGYRIVVSRRGIASPRAAQVRNALAILVDSVNASLM